MAGIVPGPSMVLGSEIGATAIVVSTAPHRTHATRLSVAASIVRDSLSREATSAIAPQEGPSVRRHHLQGGTMHETQACRPELIRATTGTDTPPPESGVSRPHP